MATRIFVVDDSPQFLASFSWCLARIDSVEQVGECLSCEEALDFLASHPVDVLIADLRFPDGAMAGPEMIRIVRDAYPNLKVMAISCSTDFDSYDVAARAGASALVSKNDVADSPERMAAAIAKVVHGETLMTTEVSRSYFRKAQGFRISGKRLLTDGQRLVLSLVASKGIKGAADALKRSVHTVNTLLYRARRTHHVHDTRELIEKARSLGEIPPAGRRSSRR